MKKTDQLNPLLAPARTHTWQRIRTVVTLLVVVTVMAATLLVAIKHGEKQSWGWLLGLSWASVMVLILLFPRRNFRPGLGLYTSVRAGLLASIGLLAASTTTSAFESTTVTLAVLLGAGTIVGERVLRGFGVGGGHAILNLPGAPPAPRVLRMTLPIVYLQLIFLGYGVLVAAMDLSAFGWLLIGLVIAALMLVRAVSVFLRRRHNGKIERQLPTLLAEYGPEFAIYAARPDDASYQVAMWLPYLERTGKKFIIVTRAEGPSRALAKITDAPIVLRRSLSDLDDLVVPSLSTFFYVNASSGNGAMVRYSQFNHVYLGHGDSDKAPSYNPTHAMYDQIYAAGPAATRRYAAHGVLLDPDKFVIVGRPQLEALEPATPTSAAEPTVLYAPTWRGHVDETFLHSIPSAPGIVAALLERRVQIVFRPHPFSYLLHTLSTALFDRPAFKRVISHGIVLGNDGQKMSKSLRNYPDVNEVFDRDGSDAMRWFLMSSSVLRGGNLVVTEEGIRESTRQVLLPLWSTWYFFSLYANASGSRGYDATCRTDSEDVLDRYLLAKTRDLITRATDHLDNLDCTLACVELRDFADVLTNWYVRRSRDRFWEGVNEDGANSEAFDTLYTVLEAVTRIAAPLLPLISERIWQGLTGGRSVHLTDWPAAEEFPADDALVAAMDQIRTISSSVLSLRKQAGLRVRLPLNGVTIVVPNTSILVPFETILHDELNIKSVTFVELEETSAETFGITSKLTVNARAAGPRLGKNVQTAIKAARNGEWSDENGVVTVGGISLEAGEYDIVLEATGDASSAGAHALLPDGGFLLLDTVLTAELEVEGIARDIVRAVQDARKSAHFDVSDRIHLRIVSNNEGAVAARKFEELICAETLAVEFDVETSLELDEDETVSVGNGLPLSVSVEKI